MKKIVLIIVAVIAAFAFNICAAKGYSDNPDYVYVATTREGQLYLNVKTIDVREYKPPRYQVGGSFVNVFVKDGKEQSSGKYIAYLFEWETKEIFSMDVYGNWEIVTTDDNTAESKLNRQIADALFNAAFKMNFYGY